MNNELLQVVSEGEKEMKPRNAIALLCRVVLAAIVVLVLPGLTSFVAAEESSTQIVRLSLEEYNRLMEVARDPKKDPREAPAGYALGTAVVNLTTKTIDNKVTASVDLNLAIEVLEDEWQGVPILPLGTSVQSVTVSGSSAQLISGPKGLIWGVKQKGAYSMNLRYQVNAHRSEGGYSLAVPLPEAAAITMNAQLPGRGLSPAIIPSAGMEASESGSLTQLRATIPSGKGVQIIWQVPSEQGYTISRAHYRGVLNEEAIEWSGELNVQLFGDESLILKLLPTSTTLNDVKLDGESAAILVEKGYFATRVSGKGLHKVVMEFQVPISDANGPPSASLRIPQIPVSRFDLKIEGKKEVTVSPKANVSRTEEGDATISTFYVPMTENVTFTWNEAVPEEIKEEVRTNSTIVHTLFAEEGVLTAQAVMQFEVTRGKTNLVEFEIPSSVQINRITSPAGLVADWRVAPGENGAPNIVSVFLNREVEQRLDLTVDYDQSIVGDKSKEDIHIPLVRARNVHRQRGMVALLSSKELTLKPIEETQLTRVGENQLPAAIRQTVSKTIAHTYKYVEESPVLIVQATKPERKQGKFDAVVNTLISLSDVTMKGSASVEVNVKSGAIMDLQLTLPKNVNFLSLSAPSLRTHKLEAEENSQRIDVFFTQEMEGQFRIELAYERILADADADLLVPTITVNGSEVEQGKIAVEALSAVEVRASRTKQLSSLEPTDLPQQLVLKTTNPILLAYKYVHVDPPYELALKITRHKEIDTQSATIDQAQYRTLITEDGLAVTSAQFMVRNSRKQFLRVALPKDSKVWLAYVDGRAEKPALAEEANEHTGGPDVLIRIINSASGFPVQLIYQSPVDKVGRLGTIDAVLPRPDMVVTQTQWDVYLPDEVSYGTPDTNMKLVSSGGRLSRSAIEAEVSKMAKVADRQVVQPLRLSVPTSGIHFSFEKLYANQSDEDAYFALPYTAGAGRYSAFALIITGTLLLWYGLYIGYRKNFQGAAGSITGGAALLGVMIGYFGVSWQPAVFVSALIAVVGIGFVVAKLYQGSRATTLDVSTEDIEA